jgi:DNA (cytosine-5)-methyltransferase 1
VDEPTYVSLFAGIEGIGLGLERAGFRCIAQVEIDRNCRRVLERHYPDVPKFDDVRTFGADALRERLGRSDPPRVDLVCGGFPCQDLSVAGKRAGLAGARSGLFYEFVRVARELRPTWLLVENVPGLLSSGTCEACREAGRNLHADDHGGEDFAIVLDELGDAGYFVEWRVLDSRWFGVPQRRRRVFLVGHLGGPPARPVLFEREGGGGDPAPRDEAGEDVAGTLGRRIGRSRTELDGHGAHIVSPAVTSKWRKGSGGPGGDEAQNLVVGTLTKGTRHYPGSSVDDAANGQLVAHALTSGGADASEDGTGRGTPLVVESLALRGREGGATAELGGDQSHALRSSQGGGDKAHVAVFRKSRRAADPLNDFDQGDVRTTHAVVAASVRRLTPTECERLQGFPDGWTCLCDADPCTCPDGPRYAALGNAVTVPVAEWIGRGIVLEIRA